MTEIELKVETLTEALGYYDSLASFKDTMTILADLFREEMPTTAEQIARAVRVITALEVEPPLHGYAEGVEAAARVAYSICAETRHVSLGDKAAAAIRALTPKEPQS